MESPSVLINGRISTVETAVSLKLIFGYMAMHNNYSSILHGIENPTLKSTQMDRNPTAITNQE